MTIIAQDLGGVVLLPCPFCGYDMTDEKDGVYQKAGFTGAQTPVWEVCCGTTMCNASVTATSRELAITAWNTRTHSAEIAGALRDAERLNWLDANGGAVRRKDNARRNLIIWSAVYAPSHKTIRGAIDSAMQQGGGEK